MAGYEITRSADLPTGTDGYHPHMWEYRWADVAAGSGPDAELTRLGADGWEAVGMQFSGEHLGKQWVRVLLKRPMPAPVAIDLTESTAATF